MQFELTEWQREWLVVNLLAARDLMIEKDFDTSNDPEGLKGSDENQIQANANVVELNDLLIIFGQDPDWNDPHPID